MDDFDDMDGLFSDLDRDGMADDVDPAEGAGGLSDDDWRAAFEPFAADGSISPEAMENLWDALADWEAAGADFEIVADFDVDAGEGNYL